MNIKTLLKKTFLSHHKMKPFNIDDAKVVILGTFPGEESLKHNRYYSNPTNKFWELLGIEFGDFETLKKKGIGLWDVLNNACERKDSADKNIKNVKETDYNDWQCLEGKYVFFNGQKAYKFYKKAIKKGWRSPLNVQGDFLPSSSGVNSRTPKKLKEQAWNEVIKLSEKLKQGDKKCQ